MCIKNARPQYHVSNIAGVVLRPCIGGRHTMRAIHQRSNIGVGRASSPSPNDDMPEQHLTGHRSRPSRPKNQKTNHSITVRCAVMYVYTRVCCCIAIPAYVAVCVAGPADTVECGRSHRNPGTQAQVLRECVRCIPDSFTQTAGCGAAMYITLQAGKYPAVQLGGVCGIAPVHYRDILLR